MSECTDIFWPRLDRESKADIERRKESNANAIRQIEQAHWESVDAVLEEARTLDSHEEARIKSAETKAAIYLSVLAAVAPLSVTLIQNFSNFSCSFQMWQIITLGCVFLIGMSYSLRGGIWAFKTIKVRGYHRVDVENLVKIDNHSSTNVALCKEILKSVRSNRDIVNEKVSCMKMAHEFVMRVFVSYSALLILFALMTIFD